MMELTNTPEKKLAFDDLRMRFQNQAVTNSVENTNAVVRIASWKGELVQKIYPIYFDDHRPTNQFDFRENFYVPTKLFLGKKYDTLYFNVAVIWSMTIFLFITLYFDLLKKAIHSLEMRRKYKRKG
jgi:hypothetical protein